MFIIKYIVLLENYPYKFYFVTIFLSKIATTVSGTPDVRPRFRSVQIPLLLLYLTKIKRGTAILILNILFDDDSRVTKKVYLLQ